MRIDISDRPQRLVPAISGKFDANWGGQFFAEVVSLSSGDHTAKIQIIFSEHSNGEEIIIRARSLSRIVTLAEAKVTADLNDRRRMDEIYLTFSLPEYDDVEISGHCEANCSTTVLRYITIVDGDGSDPEKFNFDDIGTPRVGDIKVVNFGTTGVCNASCMHCPTNKDFRKMPHGRMSMELFNKIVAELKDNGFSGEIRFGLFAEPLDDPLLKQRLEIIRNELPGTAISIATNCGLFDEKRHGFILDYANFIGVHVESVDPEIYNAYMDPLKADRVIPRVLSLLELAVSKGKTNNVGITTPVHKGNLSGLPKLYDFFSQYKSYVELTALSNRCWEEGPFTRLSLAPVGGLCMPSALHNDLFIDWDGALLPCCFDFSKTMRLGDLNTQTLAEAFSSEPWQAMYETFRGKRWSDRSACSRCRVDHQGTVQNYVAPFITVYTSEREFSPIAFSSFEHAVREADGNILLPEEAPDGNAIYGPYVRLPPGRYRVHSRIEVESFSKGLCYLELDVNADMKGPLVESRVYITAVGPVAGALDFSLDRDTLLEFRVRKVGPIRFKHSGAVVLSLAGSNEPSEATTPEATKDYTTNDAKPEEFLAAAFSFADGAHLTENGYIALAPDAADGNMIFGPYIRLPAGCYRIRPRVEVQDYLPGKSWLDLDVNVDVHRVLVSHKVELARPGPVACTLDFVLEREATVEFRVSKEGPVKLRFWGTTLWIFDQFKVQGEPIDVSGRDFPPYLFSITDLATRDTGGGIISSAQSADGNVIYGPYEPMFAGRYRVEHRFDIESIGTTPAWIEIDVVTDQGPVVTARRIQVSAIGPLSCSLDVALARDGCAEFRVSKQGPVCFAYLGALVRALREDEPLEQYFVAKPFDPENIDFGASGTTDIPSSEFSIVARTATAVGSAIITDPLAADGNVIYGPYARVPVGRYRLEPRIDVEQCLTRSAHLHLDVYAADKSVVISEKRIKVTREGPLGDYLEFALRSEALLEFRVAKQGEIGIKHSGVTLRALTEGESFRASDPESGLTGGPQSKFGTILRRRIGL